MMSNRRPRVRATVRDDDNVTELRVEVRPRDPVKRPATAPGSILPGVFPPGSWPRPGEAAHDKAVAEYKALRAAAGICRECPNRRGKYKHRCDACQAKERERQRGRHAQYAANRKPALRTVKRPKRVSQYRGKIRLWLRLREEAKHDV